MTTLGLIKGIFTKSPATKSPPVYNDNGSLVPRTTRVVPANTVDTISQICKFYADEQIELLYSNSDEFEYNNNVLVGITNYRIFHLEKDNMTSVFRYEILNYKHTSMGIFKHDLLECVIRKDGSIRSICIYHVDTCKYFCEYLKNTKNKFITPMD